MIYTDWTIRIIETTIWDFSHSFDRQGEIGNLFTTKNYNSFKGKFNRPKV